VFWGPMVHYGPINELSTPRLVIFLSFETNTRVDYGTQIFYWNIVQYGWGLEPQYYKAINFCQKPTTNPIQHLSAKARKGLATILPQHTGPGGQIPLHPISADKWPLTSQFLTLSPNERSENQARETGKEIMFELGLFVGRFKTTLQQSGELPAHIGECCNCFSIA
jgi:hypothetical protein